MRVQLVNDEVRRLGRTRGIAEHRKGEGLEGRLVVLLGLAETLLGRAPAIAPFFDSIAYNVQVAGGG